MGLVLLYIRVGGLMFTEDLTTNAEGGMGLKSLKGRKDRGKHK